MNTTFNFGSKLKNTRETMRLTIKEAAERLRINPKFLTMLEEENFNQALPLTFMRGYLRSYTRLLNFTENEINLAVNQLNALLPQIQTEKTHTVLTMPKPIKKEKWHRILTYLIIFTLILLVSLWWKSHSTNFHTTKMPLQPTPPPIQNTLTETAPKPVPPPVVTQSPQPPLKTAEASKPMKMAVPEEPGLDLFEEE